MSEKSFLVEKVKSCLLSIRDHRSQVTVKSGRQRSVCWDIKLSPVCIKMQVKALKPKGKKGRGRGREKKNKKVENRRKKSEVGRGKEEKRDVKRVKQRKRERK